MKHAIKLAFWFWVGYTATTKLAPALQAKIEALGLDDAWDVFNSDADWELE